MRRLPIKFQSRYLRDLALLVREMREHAGLTQTELARKVGTQSVIARLEDAEYWRALTHDA
jgi:predicted transcriptional regulator